MKKLLLALLLATACWADSPFPFFNGAVAGTVVNVQAAPSRLYGWSIGNPAATVCYLQVFNATAANVTLGTTTPALSIPIVTVGTSSLSFENSPVPFNVALSVAGTTTPTGSTACGTALVVNVFYL